MTMQGISNVLPKAENVVAEKSSKVKDALFESVMSSQGKKQNAQNAADDFAPDAGNVDNKQGKELSINRYQKSKAVDTKSENVSTKNQAEKPVTEPMDEVDPNEAVQMLYVQVMDILKDLFGLTQDELQDIMDSLNLQPESFVLSIGENGIMAVDTDVLKQFVLGLHGMDDASAFLTNDELNKQFQNAAETLADFVCDTVSVSKDEFANLLPENMPELLKRVVDTLQTADAGQEQVPGTTDEFEIADAAGAQVDVSIETTSSSELLKDSGQEMLMRDGSEANQSTDAEIPVHSTVAETFVNRLSQALEKSSGMENQRVTQTMDQIVEQVVRQVRIRVMPETTSMELRLNPASLGRVNLTVAASAGVATATMVVENQVAKEALESQMIQLKEAFSAQGLKVDAVEVTVAEFGLKKDGGEGNQQAEQNQSGNRKFRPDESFSDEEAASSLATSSERRDVNSTVDYTA